MQVQVRAALGRSCEWLIKSVLVSLVLRAKMDNCGNSRANTCVKRRLREARFCQYQNRPGSSRHFGESRQPRGSHGLRTGDGSFKCLPYQLSKVRYVPTFVITGNGESGFDSGEGA